ncbi:MAG: dephospho-CoA kinase, partial [Halieaceae bacterium]|nr:dephospho-CoA kinase [Halieaceae bacterium]
MNMVVGITGGIGCGKSSVTDLLKKLNVDIVDADIIARKVVEPGKFALKKIVEYFGAEILLADGSLDRAQLRVIIFSEKEKKDWLEELIHPLINDEIRAQIKSATTKYVVLSSALLLETRQKDLVDIVVV